MALHRLNYQSYRQPPAVRHRGFLPAAVLACLLCNSDALGDSNPLFDGQRTLRHIANQIALGPRSPDNLQGKRETVLYITRHLQPLADQFRVQQFEHKGLRGSNLWASFKGRHSTDTRRLMIGAHWDTRPAKPFDHSAHLGANDGASGVAVLLELARLLSLSPPPISVDLIFFDLEDMGGIDALPFSIGATEFIQANPTYRPESGIILDMLCDKSLSIPRERYSNLQAKKVVDAIWKIAAQQQAEAFKNHLGSFIKDDHLPFLDAGIPVVNLIHYPFPDYWHSGEDNLDKCSRQSLKQIGDVITEYVYTTRSTIR